MVAKGTMTDSCRNWKKEKLVTCKHGNKCECVTLMKDPYQAHINESMGMPTLQHLSLPNRTKLPLCEQHLSGIPQMAKGSRSALFADAISVWYVNEELAGVPRLSVKYEELTVNVLNDTVQTFDGMLLKMNLESCDGNI